MLLAQTLQIFEQSPLFFYGAVFIFSLTIGSFLNVVIYRLPQMLQRQWQQECREFLQAELKPNLPPLPEPISLAKPNSRCPQCGHNIHFYENIPVVSWLILKGRCSQCHNAISARYPLVELTTAVLSVIVAIHFGASIMTVAALLLTYALISLTLIDYDHMLLPDQITLPLLWLGLLVNTSDHGFTDLHSAVIGAIAGYLSLYCVFWLFKLLTGKDGMGYGDFKLFAVFGAWLGWQLLPLLILMASAVGAIIGIALMLIKKRSSDYAIPFGPYLAIAGWITLLWGDSIWQRYLSYLA